MGEEFKVVGFQYCKSTESKVERGIKNNYIPPDTLYGSNGSVRRKGEPPKILLKLDNGEVKNLYPSIKLQTTRRKVSEKFATNICEPLVGQSFESERELYQAAYNNMLEFE